MRTAISIFAATAFSFTLSASFAFAAPVVNEILFDPAGTDTALEKIEIHNPDASAADMGGWELYPDGIGYFTFPSGFSLGPQSFAVIYLRTGGTDDAANLYHSGASANVGNSSGSIALFRPGGRTKDTIADFVRYHKPGSSEKKTWESTAVDAGLWTAGTFVDISGFSEGSSIGLAGDGVRGSASSWQVFTAPSFGGANVGGGSVPPAPPPPASAEAAPPPAAESAPPPVPAPPPAPSLGADASADTLVIAGAIVEFRGLAFGLDGQPLEGARYFWNFGDGSTQEKQSPTHIFHFPGTYHANLLVQSGHYTGSDWLTVTVLPAEISISEIQPGGDGFIEIMNASAVRVDIGGMFLTDDQRFVFRIPPGTVAGPKSPVVLPSVNTRLAPTTYLDLRDARGVTLDVARLSGALPAGSSWERDGYDFRAQPTPTPGRFLLMGAVPPAPVKAKLNGSPSPPSSSEAPVGARDGPSVGAAVPADVPAALAPAAAAPPTDTELEAAVGSAARMSYAFFGASVLLGAVTAAVVIGLKRMAP